MTIGRLSITEVSPARRSAGKHANLARELSAVPARRLSTLSAFHGRPGRAPGARTVHRRQPLPVASQERGFLSISVPECQGFRRVSHPMMSAATTATTSPARTTHGTHGDHNGSNLAAASMDTVYRLSIGCTGKQRPEPPHLRDNPEQAGRTHTHRKPRTLPSGTIEHRVWQQAP